MLAEYLSTRRIITGRRPRVAICTKAAPVEIPTSVLHRFNRERESVDSIWFEPTCPAGMTEREVIAGTKGPYELVRITTLILGWDLSVIEAVVERADSPGGWHSKTHRERFVVDHNATTEKQGRLEFLEVLRLLH